MPGGYGGYQPGAASATVSGTLAHLAPPGTKLGESAITAVQRLAAAAGHPLPLPTATAVRARPLHARRGTPASS